MPRTKQRNPPSQKHQKSRDIVADLYTDNAEHMKSIAKMKNQEDIEFWCMLHDCDKYTALDYGQYIVEHNGNLPEWKIGDDKKPHYHCCFHIANPRYPSGLAYEIGLHDDDTHLFQVCHDMVKYTHYLWHDPFIWCDKHQYDPSLIEGNRTGLIRSNAYLKKSIDYEDDFQYQRIFDYIDTVEKLSIPSFTKWCIRNGLITFYERHCKIIKPYLDNEIKVRNMTIMDNDVKLMALDAIEDFGKA